MTEIEHLQPSPAAASPVRKKFRLLARAIMDGALREPGHIFHLAEGELGPHKTVVHGADVMHLEGDRDADRQVAKARDEPLYEEVAEEASEPIEERHAREMKEFEQRADAEYRSIITRHEDELAAAKEAAGAHGEEYPAPEGEPDEPAPQGDQPERARSIADKDWATRPEHGASAADANWPGRREPKPVFAGGQTRPEQGPPAMNRPFTQTGPGHDPNKVG